MIEMVMPACSMPQSVPPMLVSWRALARISGRVNVAPLVHHHQRAEELVPRGDEGEERDRDDRRPDRRDEDAQSTCQLEQPSMTAASSSSFGTASKLFRMM